MQVVHESKVLARFSNGHPQQIELVCPHCLREATFAPVAWHQHARLLAVAEATCPRCAGDVMFLLKFDRHDEAASPVLYIDPPASGRRGGEKDRLLRDHRDVGVGQGIGEVGHGRSLAPCPTRR